MAAVVVVVVVMVVVLCVCSCVCVCVCVFRTEQPHVCAETLHDQTHWSGKNLLNWRRWEVGNKEWGRRQQRVVACTFRSLFSFSSSLSLFFFLFFFVIRFCRENARLPEVA